MKVIRTAALVAAAAAAVSKAKEYARQNPAKASETIDKTESFVRGKAGPKYADKVGKGSSALRKGLGLPGTASAGSTATTTGSPTATGGSSTASTGSSTASTGSSTPSTATTSNGSPSTTSGGDDPSI